MTFSATRRSSLVSSRFRSICMMLEGLADFVASAPSGFLHSLAALSRSAAADTHVPRAMAVLLVLICPIAQAAAHDHCGRRGRRHAAEAAGMTDWNPPSSAYVGVCGRRVGQTHAAPAGG